jgi:SPP1 family predicted phage head-tail adaptor
MVKAGQYRERAEFQRLSEGSVDDYGNVYTGWASLVTRWADMRETTGKEAIEGGAIANAGLATLRVRSDSTTQGITTADRVIVRGVTWAIKGLVQIDQKNTVLEFRLERGVAA